MERKKAYKMSSEENKICVNKNFLAELDLVGTIVTGVIMGLSGIIMTGGIIGLGKRCNPFRFRQFLMFLMACVVAANLAGIGFITYKQIERNNSNK